MKARTGIRRSLTLGTAVALVTAMAGCAALPPPPSAQRGAPPAQAPAGGQASTVPASSAATAELLAQSRTQLAAGDHAQAAASIERALRIRPDDPELWLELARVRLAQGDYGQAQTLARKSIALAGDDALLERMAQAVIEEAAGSAGPR